MINRKGHNEGKGIIKGITSKGLELDGYYILMMWR